MNILALITARGGSKGLPRKNVLPLRGKPLIAWTIEAALGCHYGLRVLLSTDDPEIARVGVEWGAAVPFLRPAELAADHSDHFSVAQHALAQLENMPEYLLLLQPTSPLRTSADLDAAIALAQAKNAAAVLGVTPVKQHPMICKTIGDDGVLLDFLPPPKNAYLQRQALPPVYAPNGAIYLVKTDMLLETRSFTPSGTYPYIMPAERSLDIDTAWDLQLAEWILENH